MDAVSISASRGADVFIFDYDHLDVAYTLTLGSGNWGLYKADGTVVVGATLTPQIGTDGTISQAGTFTTSVSLAHLTTYTTARVHYDGSGFTLDYTLNNGTSWTTLPEDGVIVLPANADLDIRVSFPGGIANDPAVLNSLSVYVLNTETMNTLNSSRVMTLTNSQITSDGLVAGTNTPSVSAATTGTIEMWVTPTTNTVLVSPPAGTVYTNGVAGSPLAGIKQHVVYVVTTPASVAFTLNGNATYEHLAIYPQAMTTDDVAALYSAQNGGLTITVSDTSTIAVTEPSPATDIYAFAWQIQSGGS